MAKKPVKPTSGSRAPERERTQPASAPAEAPAEPAGATELDALEGELTVSASELDELESRLNARLAGAALPAEAGPGEDAPPERPAAAPRAAGARPPQRPSAPEPERPGTADETPPADEARPKEPPAAAGRRGATAGRKLGPAEWAALGGFALVTLMAGGLFLKFLYGHPAPIQGKGLSEAFELPMAGPAVRLSAAEAAWRERAEGDKAQADEVVVPTLTLTLDSGHASKGFVRVEFVDSEQKIRGDVLTLTVEGGRFTDSGRGEAIEEGGLKARLTGTVGFRSKALFTSYQAGEEPRWSVRVKEGPDYSNGPWTELGAALIPNTKH